ncbi:hypothetical protein [Enterococcus thailandicus]|uniref:Uncharacterized protein n=1 Tax=Enterococcus thailandicus TaxID=417368 RepID=A0A179EQM4_ENTTH|nr:hypothetical protein [Enterococcus thailandicus]OAQ55537.1 hypothetical protein A6E74_08595 [Enterococcus thailandicus]
MNEKIKTLLNELQNECAKENVTAICTLNKNGECVNMAVGDSVADFALCLAIQEESLDEELTIPSNVLRSAGIEALNEMESANKSTNNKHTIVVDDLNDLPNIFERILRGDFK